MLVTLEEKSYSKPIVAFTGHRPDKIGGYNPNPLQDKIRKAITDVLIKIQPEKAISGMALGVDQWAAEICIDLKIPLIAAVPFKGQERIWPQKSKDHYFYLLDKAAEVKIISDGGYAGWKMNKRNEWMVDNCALLIAVWDGTKGGTSNAVKYAESINRDTYRIDPCFLK